MLSSPSISTLIVESGEQLAALLATVDLQSQHNGQGNRVRATQNTAR